jgi:hypothetical protein
MPQYTQAKLDETIALLDDQGYQIENSWRQGFKLVKVSSGTPLKMEIYFNAEKGTLRVAGNSWPSELYTRIHAALSNPTFEFEAVPIIGGPPERTSFWFFSDDDAQRDELLRLVKAILAIAGVAVPHLNAVA